MSQLARISFQGALPAGDEFQHGFYVEFPDGTLISQACSWADDALTNFLGGAANLKGYYQAETVWTGPLVEFLSHADGSIMDSLNGVGSGAGDHVGGVNLPGEVACATTFRTARTDGSGRGRSFLPPPGHVALTNNGRWTSAFCSAVANAWVQLSNTVSVADDLSGLLVVWSQLHHETNLVTVVECGDVPDAMRSRRNGITEVRTGASIL